MDSSKNDFREFVLAALAQYESRLVHYTTRLFGGKEDRGRDVVQHAFMKLCQQNHEDVVDCVGPWLFRVCRNRVIDKLRRRGASNSVDELLFQVDCNQVDPSLLAERADLMEYVRSLVVKLPTAQREVVELWSHGLRHEEIGNIMGKKAGAVRGILHRAIQTLKHDPQICAWLDEPQGGSGQLINQAGTPPGDQITTAQKRV